MKDEEYAFTSDVIEKKITARSAFNRKSRGGRVRLPSDNLSKKELSKMNGECKSYRLNSPMTKAEFFSMPDDLKVAYVKAIRKKYNAPDSKIGEMLGTDQKLTSYHFRKLGCNSGKNSRGGGTEWDKDGFYAWMNGVEHLPKVVEEPVKEEVFLEEDVSFEEETEATVSDVRDNAVFHVPVPVTATPASGTLRFMCPADQALFMIGTVLGNANVQLTVSWDVCETIGKDAV